MHISPVSFTPQRLPIENILSTGLFEGGFEILRLDIFRHYNEFLSPTQSYTYQVLALLQWHTHLNVCAVK